MLFRLKVLSDGQIQYWTYDNYKNVVYDPTGHDPYANIKPKRYRIGYVFNGEDTNYYIIPKLVNVLYILLGMKCNFHCKYCQEQNNSDLIQDPIPDATPENVYKLLDVLRESKVVPNEQVIFWGGEPLVYWKALKILIPELRKLYPQTHFHFITNGSLIDEEKVDFFAKYNVGFSISYDGRHTLRDYPVFDDQKLIDACKKKAFVHKRRISILPCMSPGADKPSDIREEVKAKLGTNVSVAFHSVVRCNDDKNTFSIIGKLSDEDKKRFMEDIENELNKPIDQMEKGLLDRLTEFRNSIALGIPITSTRTYCQNCQGKHITIDMNGDVRTCMNVPKKSYGPLTNWKNIKITDFYNVRLKARCMKCPYLNLCLGECPLLKDTETEAFRTSCSNMEVYAKPVFNRALSSLYGFRLLEIEPIE